MKPHTGTQTAVPIIHPCVHDSKPGAFKAQALGACGHQQPTLGRALRPLIQPYAGTPSRRVGATTGFFHHLMISGASKEGKTNTVHTRWGFSASPASDLQLVATWMQTGLWELHGAMGKAGKMMSTRHRTPLSRVPRKTNREQRDLQAHPCIPQPPTTTRTQHLYLTESTCRCYTTYRYIGT